MCVLWKFGITRWAQDQPPFFDLLESFGRNLSDVQNGAGASPSSHSFLKYSEGVDYKYYTMCVSDDVDYEIPICDFELKS